MRRALAAAVALTVGALASPAPATGPATAGPAATTGRDCTDAELAALVQAPPPGVPACRGLAPGVTIRATNIDKQQRACSAGFVFRGSDARTYLSTTGSCLLGARCLEVVVIDLPVCVTLPGEDYSDREPIFPPGRGLPVFDGAGRRVGEWAYAIYTRDMDFGLVRIDRGVPVNPQMCHYGGPTGVETAVRAAPETLHQVGVQLAADGLASKGLSGKDHVTGYYGEPFGGIVTTADGKAVGMVGNTFGADGARIQRLPAPVARARHKLRLRALSLVTAPAL